MRFLKLTLGPELVHLGEPVTRIEVLNNQYLTDGTVIELSRFESGEHVADLLDNNPATLDYEVLETESGQQYVYHHIQPDNSDFPHQLLPLLDEHRLLVVYPIVFDNETGASVTLMGTTERVQEAFSQLPNEIQPYIEIEQITETMPSLGGLRSILTDRQREVLDAAIEMGYYSVPRNVTSTEIAEEVGCAPSTASEHLRKIECKILSSLSH